MSILDVTVDRQRRSLLVGDGVVPLRDRFDECASADIAQIGVRARDLEIVDDGTPGTLPASVYIVEPMGDEVYVDVLIGSSRVSVRADRGWTAPIGARIGVRVDPERACFFDREGTTSLHRTTHQSTTQQKEGTHP